MQTHLERAFAFLRGALVFFTKGIRELWSAAIAHKLIAAAGVIVIVGGIVAITHFFGGASSSEPDARREVTLLNHSDLSSAEPLSLIGEIRSVSEALVATEVSGSVSGVYRSLGDYVAAGTAIAELKNASQRAALAQAEAALEKAKSGATVAGISVESAETSLTAAQESAKSVITSVYATVDDAISKKADETFSNPNGPVPTFFVSTSDSQLARTVESGRLSMQPILKREASAAIPSDTDSLLAEMQTLLQETTAARNFMANVVQALNSAVSSGSVTDAAIAGYRTDASAGLSSVNSVRASLSAAIENLKAKEAALAVAKENLSGGSSTNPDVRAAEANVAVAEAALEKTIIRAPISGTINRLDLDVGSFVSASAPVVYITNAHGLEAVVYVSERDIKDIRVGAAATVSGSVEARVSRIASALDPVTKKAEVRVALPEGSGLVSGSSASVSIHRAALKTGDTLAIPLSALKITPVGNEVFTVNEGVLVAHPVVTGTLRGSTIEVVSGIEDNMRIVKDVRGLSAGQEVIVKGE